MVIQFTYFLPNPTLGKIQMAKKLLNEKILAVVVLEVAVPILVMQQT